MMAISLRDIAKTSGYSLGTVSMALRDSPKIPEKTRNVIKKAAKELGYRMNPLVHANMIQVRQKASGGARQVIGVVGECLQGFHYPQLLSGIKKRADELGFKVDVFDLATKELLYSDIDQILQHRNIRGIILTALAGGSGHRTLDWPAYSIVTIGHSISRPYKLNRIAPNEFEMLDDLLQRLRKKKYKRIGLAMPALHDLHVRHYWRAAYLSFEEEIPFEQRIPIFIPNKWNREAFLNWVESHHPDAIIGSLPESLKWLQEAGYRIPEDIGWATVYRLPEWKHCSGIDQNFEQQGELAVTLLTGQLYHNQYGLPPDPHTVTIQGKWKPGKTTR